MRKGQGGHPGKGPCQEVGAGECQGPRSTAEASQTGAAEI